MKDPSDSTAPTAGALRMARHRARRRKGLRCFTIELYETEDYNGKEPATWAEIDLEARLWRVPAKRMERWSGA
jgi:hypothetical protein